MAKTLIDSKICSSCGRTITYRKKWVRTWHSVKYCSHECRDNANRFDYRDQIIALLQARNSSASICPSEVLEPEQKQDAVTMEHVRRSARLLAAEGRIEITQRGKVVDPQDFKGPIRLRFKRLG